MAQAKEYSRLLVVFSIIYFQIQIRYKDLSKKLYRFLNFISVEAGYQGRRLNYGLCNAN